jgi:hypothetical protein
MKIGIVGATGDLAKQLSAALHLAGLDIMQSSRSTDTTPQNLIDQCDIVHICAPLNDTIAETFTDCRRIVVLHSSTMQESQDFIKKARLKQFLIVHFLMNPDKKVIVAQESTALNTARVHLETAGFRLEFMEIAEHDALIALSQGLLASLVDSGVHAKLEEICERGLLTPSGNDLLTALRSREMNWTENTLDSIMKNPNLHDLRADLKKIVMKWPPKNHRSKYS